VALDDVSARSHYHPHLHEFEILHQREYSRKPDGCPIWYNGIWHFRINPDVYALASNNNREYRSQGFSLSDGHHHWQSFKLHFDHLSDVPVPTLLDILRVYNREAPEAELREQLLFIIKVRQHESHH